MKIVCENKYNIRLRILSYFIYKAIQAIKNNYKEFDIDTEHISELMISKKLKDNNQIVGRAYYNKIVIYMNNVFSYNSMIFIILHEIGHSIRIKNSVFDHNYNSTHRNIAYYREEIYASEYAINIIKKYLNKKSFLRLLDDCDRIIKSQYDELKILQACLMGSNIVENIKITVV